MRALDTILGYINVVLGSVMLFILKRVASEISGPNSDALTRTNQRNVVTMFQWYRVVSIETIDDLYAQ